LTSGRRRDRQWRDISVDDHRTVAVLPEACQGLERRDCASCPRPFSLTAHDVCTLRHNRPLPGELPLLHGDRPRRLEAARPEESRVPVRRLREAARAAALLLEQQLTPFIPAELSASYQRLKNKSIVRRSTAADPLRVHNALAPHGYYNKSRGRSSGRILCKGRQKGRSTVRIEGQRGGNHQVRSGCTPQTSSTAGGKPRAEPIPSKPCSTPLPPNF
jgi:hypothetical protein